MKVIDIDESTRVPVRIVGWLITIAVGGAGWLTTMTFNQSAQGSQLTGLVAEVKTIQDERKVNREAYLKTVARIDKNLAIIGTAMRLKVEMPPEGEGDTQ